MISIVLRGLPLAARVQCALDARGVSTSARPSEHGRDVYVVHAETTRETLSFAVAPDLLAGAIVCDDALEAMLAVPAPLSEAA